jgi:hypothetical protein
MRIILKILAAPFVVVLTISWVLLVFLFCWAEKILNFISGIVGLITLAFFIFGQTQGGIVFAIIAFLISPVGLPLVANWLIDKLDDLNDALKCFITT